MKPVNAFSDILRQDFSRGIHFLFNLLLTKITSEYLVYNQTNLKRVYYRMLLYNCCKLVSSRDVTFIWAFILL